MSTSFVYRSPLIYDAVMLALYGRHAFARCRVVADLIPAGASILELCCGPGTLYHRHMRGRGVQYTGLDINPPFISRLKAMGATGRVWDLQRDTPLPEADYVIMQASLYHFLPDPAPVVDRMLAAAGRRVIVAEPIRNLSDSRVPILASLARRQTDPGTGAQARRFNEATLDAFFARYAPRVERSFLIPGGREKVYVLAA
ncbi:MAG TPA: methyltransferase domain-containing protein [Tepidisphaeraceae bacterium]